MVTSHVLSLMAAAGPVATVILVGLITALSMGGALAMAGVKVDPNSDLVKLMAKMGFTDALGGPKYAYVIAKTADYMITAAVDQSGTVFTNRGAGGAVIFTLPAPSQALAGVYYEFEGVANQNMTVSAGTGLGVSLNNATCASLAASTSNLKIGAHILAKCDGTSWLLLGDTVGCTYTVA